MSPSLYRKTRNYGCRITDDLIYKGSRSLLLENEVLLIHLLLDKGSEPIRWLHKPTDTDFIWQTRVGFLPDNALYPDYQMSYLGGWQELFPEVSETHKYRGALLHRGESAVTPWDYQILHDDSDEIRVLLTNRIRSLPFRMEKEIRLRSGEAIVHYAGKIINESLTTAMEANWGHHLAYGTPFIDEQTRVDIAEGTLVMHPISNNKWLWPQAMQDNEAIDLSRMAAPGTKRDLLYMVPEDGCYRLSRPADGLALEVRWDQEVWPYLWYWQNYQGDQDAPFFGCEYNIGLEMFNVPPKWTVAEAVKRGKALIIAPNSSLSSWLEIEVVAP